ncbi:hypothetical protein GCM10007973_32140 [Polymorphobacter multimanifer]|uniref:Putative membrane channel-forming protein YqfA (Hemolysin III family) n=1 Tax=Polymorphobacter multimanifer TaxID=1070431 RepID=A0A841LHJ4_9SPHN|nr:hypothetical protein [Polymorphobacter multimanifer]MBB6228672.1 putative membrane channel-forming protein YqfA (hemolysin III family) [Polymorphobacter multimanifer]GGI93439.1 hypothetical protein GCM10007973_32140 [Polymorphobacter multimanifer]
MEPEIDPAPDAAPGHDQYVTLEYDFLKHLTSLSLIAIGGALTFAGSIFAEAPDKTRLWLAIAVFIASGTLGFTGQHTLLKQQRLRRPLGRSVSFCREVGMGLFGLGAGTLVAFAYGALGAPTLLPDFGAATPAALPSPTGRP